MESNYTITITDNVTGERLPVTTADMVFLYFVKQGKVQRYEVGLRTIAKHKISDIAIFVWWARALPALLATLKLPNFVTEALPKEFDFLKALSDAALDYARERKESRPLRRILEMTMQNFSRN